MLFSLYKCFERMEMDQEKLHRILQYLGDAVQVCEKDGTILGVTISFQDEDETTYLFDWIGEGFVGGVVND